MFIRHSLSLAAALLLINASPSHAAKSTTYEKEAFKPALDTAVGKIYKNHSGRTDLNLDSAGGKAPYEEVANVSPAGAWKIGLGIGCVDPGENNYTSSNYKKLMHYNAPAVVANNRDSLTYVFVTQAVDDAYITHVEKNMAVRKYMLMNEFKDVTATLERQADKTYKLTALYSYAAGVSPSHIADRLYFLIHQSGWLLCDVHTGIELANIDQRHSQDR